MCALSMRMAWFFNNHFHWLFVIFHAWRFYHNNKWARIDANTRSFLCLFHTQSHNVNFKFKEEFEQGSKSIMFAFCAANKNNDVDRSKSMAALEISVFPHTATWTRLRIKLKLHHEVNKAYCVRQYLSTDECVGNGIFPYHRSNTGHPLVYG